MIWASSVRAYSIKDPEIPCIFNALCTCSSGLPENFGNVKCENVLFPAIPETLNISKVYSLKMENTGLTEIQPYFLQATGLYRLEINHNPLYDIHDDALNGLERSLWELILRNNGLAKIPTKSMKYLQKLRLLDLSRNEISLVERDSFRGLQNSLHTLILADNAISHLSIEAFQGLPNLNTLDLSSNNLHEILPDVFREQMNSLVKVIFADNLLTEIPYIPLSMLKSLKYLDISQNMITGFQSKAEAPQQNIKLTLEQLHLEYNQIHVIQPASFQNFLLINQTFLDFNPIHIISDDAFQSARINELYIRHCRLDFIEPSAFSGLESSLKVLDLSGNNITTLPEKLFNSFDLLHTLNVKDNKIHSIYPNGNVFTGFQYSLLKFDITGDRNGPTNLQELKRMKSLRSLSVSSLLSTTLKPEDFLEFDIELENLKIYRAGLREIKAHAFMNVRGIKRLDLSENSLDVIEKGAFQDIAHTLVSLKIAHGFSTNMQNLPDLRDLTSLEEINFSNNRLKNIDDYALHSNKNLKTLRLTDNQIEQIPKGIFQPDIHRKLEEVSLEFNNLRHISTHTFVDLEVI
jgi:Leucine-rich repeat (LRR) protein